MPTPNTDTVVYEMTWTIAEVATMFKKQPKTIREWKDRGEFNEGGGYLVFPGGDFGITDSALRAFIARHRVRTTRALARG